jgi:adenylate kinase
MIAAAGAAMAILPADERHEDVDLRNANQIFREAWAELQETRGRENLRFPKEIMWLGGAPGAGKGTNTPFIMRERDITAQPIVMSALLDTPEMKALKDQGKLIGDREAVAALLRELLEPRYANGVVVDGFPRTAVQCGCVRLLFQKMLELRQEFFDAPFGPEFRRPIFRLTVLYVTEQVSIDRQLKRGEEIEAANAEVRSTGVGELQEVRATDVSEEHAATRYRIFREQTMDALQRLRDHFQYHFIDANGPIDEVEGNIIRELAYQSTLELAEDTHDSIRNIPLASALTEHARQHLVRRLDNYRHRHAALFRQVVELIERDIVPGLRRYALAGTAHVRVENPTLDQNLAIDMAVDVLAERGYFPTAQCIQAHVPLRVDPDTGAIVNAIRKIWAFELTFKARHIRRE